MAGKTYKQIAEKHGVTYNEVLYLVKKKQWKRESNLSKVKKGNQNAKGNKGGPGAEKRNTRALKTGEYETIYDDLLTDEEKEQRFSFEMRLSNPRTMGDTYEIIIENELSSRKKQIIFSDSNIRAISVDKTVFSTPNILDLNNFVSEVENYFGIQFNFEKIAYLSVSKGINRKQIEKWVKNKFVI